MSPFQNTIRALSEYLMRRRGRALSFFLLFLLGAAYTFHSLAMDTSVVSLFPDSSPRLAAMGRLLPLNPGARVMLVEFSSADSAQQENMHELAFALRERMTPLIHLTEFTGLPEPEKLLALVPALFDADMEKLWKEKTSPERITSSIGTVKAALSGGATPQVKAFLRADPLSIVPALLQRFPSPRLAGQALSVESLTGQRLPRSDDGRRLLLILQPKVDMKDTKGAVAFMSALRGNLEQVLAPFPDIRATIAGSLRFTEENSLAIERDLALTVSLSLICIGLIYLFTVRSLGAVWLFLTPIVAVIFAGSAMSFIWPVTAGIALGFGAAVLGLAEDYAVLTHFALRGNPGRKAEAIALLSRPMAFSCVLCMAGFGVLMLSGIPAIRQLGFFASFSLLVGLGTAMFILPCCPWIDRPHITNRPQQLACGIQDLRPKLLPALLLAAMLCAGCFFGLRAVRLDTSFQALGVNSERLQEELRGLHARWRFGSERDVWASSADSLDAALEESAALASLLRSRVENEAESAVFSLADVIPPFPARAENMRRWQAFVREHAAAIEENLLRAGQAQGFTNDAFSPFSAWLAAPQSADSAALLRDAGLADMLWWFMAEQEGKFHVLSMSEGLSIAENDWPGGSVLLSSSAVEKGFNSAFAAEKRLLPLACLICLALLFLCFRKPLLVLLACLPPLFGLSAVLAWLLISGSSLNLAGLAALTLVIGLGADYGIVMLHELASEMSLGAFRSIAVSGLTTLAGLGVLVLAEHPVLHTLGSITFFGLCAEMAAVLLLIPVLCKKSGLTGEGGGNG